MSANADPGGWNILPPVTLPPSERLDHVRGCSEFAAHLLDRHPDLVVRVTGFSAFFASLSEELRKYVVDRIV